MRPELERVLEHLYEAAGAGDDEVATVADRCWLWLDLGEFDRQVHHLIEAAGEDATDALVAAVGPHSGRRSVLETRGGLVHLERESPKRRARGRDVAELLSSWMVDPQSGQFVRAVPLDVLADVVPAIASEEVTAYGWRWRQLEDRLGDEYANLVVETPFDERRLVLRPGAPR